MHYAKDVVTQEGLPIVGSSLFTKANENCENLCGYSFENIFYKKVANELSSYRFSDLNSYLLSKIVVSVYSNAIAKERGFTNKQKKNYKQLMKIVTWTMMIAIQMFLLDKGVKEGGRLNLIVIPELIAGNVSLLQSTIAEHREIMDKYEKMNEIIRQPGNKICKEYSGIEKEPYFFENNNHWYISEEKILEATQEVLKEASIQEQKQIVCLKKAELLKYNLANNIIKVDEYRTKLKNLMQEFYLQNKFCGLDKTNILLKFYKIVNELYREENDNEI